MAGHESSVKAIFYALLANLGIAISKGLAAFYTGSGSMLAEAIHSTADCANQLLLFLGLKRSERPPTAEHPLGYGKVVYFWSFIVAMLLFSMGGMFSIYEGIHKLTHPEPVRGLWVGIAVLAVSIVFESISLSGALRQIKIIRQGSSLRQWLKNTRNAELIVVLGEDTAALLGLTLALFFILLTALTGDPFFDSLGSICIGSVLIAVSLFLIIRLKSLLIGRSASPELQDHLNREIAGHEHINKVFNIITMQFGPHVVLAAKISIDKNIDVESACGLINGLEADIKKHFPEVRWCFIEPDMCD